MQPIPEFPRVCRHGITETDDVRCVECQQIAHAEGMLAAIKRNHECTEACTGTTVLGDGSVLHLRCPWEHLDMSREVDRRIIAAVYADEAKAAMGR